MLHLDYEAYAPSLGSASGSTAFCHCDGAWDHNGDPPHVGFFLSLMEPRIKQNCGLRCWLSSAAIDTVTARHQINMDTSRQKGIIICSGVCLGVSGKCDQIPASGLWDTWSCGFDMSICNSSHSRSSIHSQTACHSPNWHRWLAHAYKSCTCVSQQYLHYWQHQVSMATYTTMNIVSANMGFGLHIVDISPSRVPSLLQVCLTSHSLLS